LQVIDLSEQKNVLRKMHLKRMQEINNLSEEQRLVEIKKVIKKYQLFNIEIKEDFTEHLEFVEQSQTDN
jgi:hypothetical protein